MYIRFSTTTTDTINLGNHTMFDNKIHDYHYINEFVSFKLTVDGVWPGVESMSHDLSY